MTTPSDATDPVTHRIAGDARRRVRGTMPFAIDRRLPDVRHAAVVRSYLPSAAIDGVEVGAARAHPGVLAVVTGEDVRTHPQVANPFYGESRADQPVLAIDRVRYVGEPIAVVVAETLQQARTAARLVEIDLRELPLVGDLREAERRGAAAVHDDYPDNGCGRWRLEHGDLDAGWRDAERVFEHVYESPGASHVPLEPHVASARWAAAGLEVFCGTQSPYNVQKRLMAVFGLEADRIRIRGDNLGGGFGSKTDARIEPLVAAAALVSGEAVRLELTREEVFYALAKHAARVRIRTGVRLDGAITAREIDIVYDAGAYANTTPRSTRTGMVRSPGPYRIPAVRARARGVYTNTVPTGPFRGAMTGQVCWAHESTIDEIAVALGLSPLEIRRRNLLREGDTYATGETMHDVRFLEVLEAVAEALPGPGAPSAPGLVRGVGYASVLKSTRTPSRSEARVVALPGGRFVLHTSSVDMGQGLQFAMASELAGRLGITPEEVEVSCADTAWTPFDTTTSSSRSTFCMGNAVRAAGSRLAHDLHGAAAALFEVVPGEVERVGSRFRHAGEEVDIRDLVDRAGGASVVADGVYETPEGMGVLDPTTTQGIASVHWHQGAVGVEVEVDPETGVVRVVRAHGAVYAGRVVDPMRVKQQTEGGMIFGLGQALSEELIHDNGQLLNPNLAEYLIPSILDAPAAISSTILSVEDPEGEAHGVGENTVPPMAPAVANAVHDAVGVRIRQLPITAERVLRAIDDGRRS